MRRTRAVDVVLLASVLTLGLIGCGSNDDGGEADPTTTLEGCVQTVEGCIDPDSIEPGECIPSGPTTDDCVNYTEPTSTTAP